MAQVPIYEVARGGTVITGLGGDGVFSSWRWKLVDELLARPWKARVAHLRTAGSALMPKSVRERRAARRWDMPPPWLRPEARHEVTRLWAQHNARQPVSWRGYVDYIARARYHALMLETLSRLAEGSGARTFHPMLDPAFLSALGAEWRPGRFSSRTDVMHYLFADLLPAEMVSRPTKGEFTQAFFGQKSREFAREWDGAGGVDESLVDPERLRSFWLDDDLRDFRCSTALQSAWLASQDGSS
jgi:asparagine synthase (glutamine-hydrolysing)